tara:strand:+ start:1602 stop:2069 length:468 start_codon:yes stop_codon:yes gene_type:complete
VVWIFGVGIGLTLLFIFPKQMIILIFCVIVGLGIFWISVLYKDYKYAKKIESVVMLATFNDVRCTAEFPILINFINNNSETLLSINFNLGGYRDGYSAPNYNSAISYTSDRILASGQNYEACWNIPALKFGQQAVPAESLSWKATYSHATFGNPP